MKNKNQLNANYYFIVLLIGSTCFGPYYAHHQDPGTVPRDSEVPEYFWVTPGSRNSSRVSGIPEQSWVTPGICSPLSDSGNPESYVWLRKPVVLRVTTGTRNIPGDFGTLSSVWTRESGVPGDSWNPEFPLTLGTRVSEWLRNPGTVPGDSWIPEHIRISPGYRNSSGWRLDLWRVPRESGKPGFPVILGSRKISPRFRFPGTFPGDSGIPDVFRGLRGPEKFWVTPGTQSSWWPRELGVPGGSGSTEVLVTPESRNSSVSVLDLIRVPCDSVNPEFRVIQGNRNIPDYFRNPESFWWLQEAGCSLWLQEPGVLRITPGTRNFIWLWRPYFQVFRKSFGWLGSRNSFGLLRGPESSGLLGEQRVLRVSRGTGSPLGDSESPEFRVSSGPRVLRGLREPSVHLVTTGIRSSW